MATTAEVRESVKSRLGIKTATITFDSKIDEFVLAAVKRLYPTACLEVAAQEVTSFTVDNYGEAEINLATLSSPIRSARQVEAYDGWAWRRISRTYHHGTKMRVRELTSSDTKIRIYGLLNFTAVAEVYDWLLQAIYWYAMAEFFDYLAGNKSNYNIYAQATGARAVDNMRDESDYYAKKATDYLEEQSQAYGL